MVWIMCSAWPIGKTGTFELYCVLYGGRGVRQPRRGALFGRRSWYVIFAGVRVIEGRLRSTELGE